MIKHFIGFALFSFIVGTAVFISATFNGGAVEEAYTPVDYSNYAQTKSCWKMKRELNRENVGTPMVKQAIFDLESKQLRWKLDTAGVDTPIVLNFFVKSEKGMRYVNSALVPMLAYQDGSVRATSSYEWLDNLDSYENLYVTAEPISPGAYRNKNFQKDFDVSRSTPVLIY